MIFYRPFSMKRLRFRPSAAVAFIALLLAIAPTGQTEEPPVYAIAHARVVCVSAPTVEKATVIVRNGIIEAVGSDVIPPNDARIIDGRGLTVYPGFIDGLSDVGLEEARTQTAPTTRTSGSSGLRGAPRPQTSAEAPDETPILTPYLQAADILTLSDRKIEAARSAGITTALVAPRRGFFQGQSSLVNLSGTNIGKMVVKTPVAMHVALPNMGGFGGSYPRSLMGVFAFIKQTFLDTQHHEAAWSIYNVNPGSVRPEYSRALQALHPVLKRQMPVVMPGDTPTEIARSLDLAASFNLSLVLSGGAEAGKIASVLREKKIPVLLSVKFPERDRDADPDREEELEVLRRRVEAPANAAALAKAGVQFAFQSDDIPSSRDFIRNVAKTVEAGLDKETALRALTLTPAEIFGVADRLGTIEKGKTANLTVTTGDIFDTRTRVKYVFIDGQLFEPPEPESPRSIEPPLTGTRNNFSGAWTLKMNSPQGPRDITVNLDHTSSVLSGTVSSPRGTTPILEGTVSGDNVTFKISVGASGEGSQVITFTGTMQGNNIVGSADFGAAGKRDFSGSRSPRLP